ncbi:MAG: type II toxin-antitoxin system MqsA family antitoxin [Candidatus Hydrogenedentes bacterium]|nr:type II toxin-antitoxin system MqsA family antitoxin [Candidatus Hydrogenedentota bacterium]
MREKKWIDCPICGAKKSMRHERGLHEDFELPEYPALRVPKLDGQFCSVCGEGFWSLKSERNIAERVAEHMAAVDATRVVAAELASVQEAAQRMRVSVQGVHKMMKEGRLRFVVAGGRRLPLRSDLPEARSAGAKWA